MLAGSLVLLGGVMAIFSPRFADTVVRASSTAATKNRVNRATAFRAGSRQQALRWKEFLLLRRDPWLMSQSLMQLLYLVPPALLLWRSFSDNSAAIVLITPVIVMAAGQLAGGLAWLTISGEDAADLVATAPLPSASVTRAKIEVVLITITAIFAPLVAALAFAFGIAVVALVYLIAAALHGHDRTLVLVLSGVVVGALAGAGVELEQLARILAKDVVLGLHGEERQVIDHRRQIHVPVRIVGGVDELRLGVHHLERLLQHRKVTDHLHRLRRIEHLAHIVARLALEGGRL